MKRNHNLFYCLVGATLALSLLTTRGLAADNSFLGHWALTIPSGGAGWLGIEQKGDQLEGSILWGGGSVVPVSAVKVEGDTLVVTRVHQRRRRAQTPAAKDIETIRESVKKTGRCVVVQEAPRTLGISSEIIARINDDALMHLEAPVKRLTGFDVVTPYFAREKRYMPTADRARRAIEETLDF